MKSLGRALSVLFTDYGLSLSSAVAFSFMLSLFPLLVVTASLVALFGNELMIKDILDGVALLFPEEITKILMPELTKVLNNLRVDFLTIGGLLMLFFASAGTQSLRGALNRAYEVEEERSITWLFVHGFFFVIQFTFVLIVIGVAFFSASILAKKVVAYATYIQIGCYAVAFAVMAIELLIIHAYLPSGRRTLGQIWSGAFLSTLLWIFCVVGYSFYLSIANFEELYGGLSQFVIVLIFFQVTALIIIFGASFNHARMEQRKEYEYY